AGTVRDGQVGFGSPQDDHARARQGLGDRRPTDPPGRPPCGEREHGRGRDRRDPAYREASTRPGPRPPKLRHHAILQPVGKLGWIEGDRQTGGDLRVRALEAPALRALGAVGGHRRLESAIVVGLDAPERPESKERVDLLVIRSLVHVGSSINAAWRAGPGTSRYPGAGRAVPRWRIATGRRST